MEATALATGKYISGFYPTPKAVAYKMLDTVKLSGVNTILEPSAGKGDLVQAYIDYYNEEWGRYHSISISDCNVDCIEIDPDLQSILRGKGFHVVHNDFLTYNTYKQYDLILMNPPFDHGAEHLLKAVSMIEYGGKCVCLLNAETLRNPYSYTRKQLWQKINQYQAKVEYLKAAFEDAERSTDVETVIVTFDIPKKPHDSSILDGMRKAEKAKEIDTSVENMEISKFDFIDAMIDRYNYEVRCGLRLMEEYSAVSKLIQTNENGENAYDTVFYLQLGGKYGSHARDVSVNEFLVRMRRKFWSILFEHPRFVERMTKNLRDDLRRRVESFGEYEFSAYNIYHLAIEMSKKVNSGIEATIMKLFDDWTRKYHWDENAQNRHYFDGWKTNDAFAVNKKVIVPMYHYSFTGYNGWFGYDSLEQLHDIEKVFDFLDAGRTNIYNPRAKICYDIRKAMEKAKEDGQTRKIPCKYFNLTVYKKGTAHIEFTNMEVLEKFNIFAAMGKNWLPPAFGKKRYAQMDEEEKRTVDSFMGGEKEYEKVMADAEFYLPQENKPILLLNAG